MPVFVFVDEINATLGSSLVYGAFLSALEAGNYMRRGRRFELKPCIWMFAGALENAGRSEGAEQKKKLDDFQSQLTMIERIDYQSMKKLAGNGPLLPDQARREQVYLANLINELQ